MSRTASTSPGDVPMTSPAVQHGAVISGKAAPAFLTFRLCVLIFLGFTILGAWFPFFTLHLENLGFTAEQTAWASATNALGALIAPLIWGQVADRWLATERCISLCALATAVGLLLLASLADAWSIIFLLIVMWMFLIPALGLMSAFIFRQLDHPEKDFGKIRMWGTVGWIVAGWTLTAWWWLRSVPADYVDSLQLGALASLALAGYALTLPHTPPRARTAASTGGKSWLLLLTDAPLNALRLFRDRSFAVYAGCMFGVYVTMPFTIQLNPLLLKQIGIDRSLLPTYMTIAQSMEVVLLGLLPFFLMRLGMKTTMLIGGLTWIFGLSALSIGTPTWLVFVAFASFGFFICGFLVAGQVFVNRQASHNFRASAQGLLLLIAGVGQLLGHLVVGWIRAASHDNFSLAYAVAAGISVLMLAVFVIGFSPTPRPAIPAPEPDTQARDALTLACASGSSPSANSLE